ncbi:MAG TPA: hypothetical protein VGQ76_22495 [Thermoanaerobaculia bacterium]|jgi:hypothetical protein|nr:hypothetical protein [Thermoanaerobaculia bacterium]
MRKALFLILALAVFLPGKAVADGDLAITSFTIDKTTLQTGEAFTVDLRIKNKLPVAAEDITLFLSTTWPAIAPMRVLSTVTPAGWQCATTSFNCYGASLAAGAEVQLTYHITAPATLRPEPLILMAHVGLNGNDANPEDNNAEAPLTLQLANRSADLSIAVSAPPSPVPFNTPLTFAYDVRNNGPQDLSDVRIAFFLGGLPDTRVFEGAGWTCAADNLVETTCRRTSLAANTNAPLSVRFTTPNTSGSAGGVATVFANEPHVDANLSNNAASAGVNVGEATEWDRLLAPFAATEIHGANGSLWKTEISAVIESDHYPELGPIACGPVEDPCSFPPLNQLFDASDDLVFDGVGPQFVYVGKDDASKVKMVTRVYDATKNETTAGAFVPTARNDDFSSEGFSLIAIPVAPQFRSTLRIYDATGADNREVDLALYGDAEKVPFLQTTATLHTLDEQQLVTTAELPLHPSISQLDLSSLIPAGYSRIRVTIRPRLAGATPEMKLWGFASITNNETSHVSVVTP